MSVVSPAVTVKIRSVRPLFASHGAATRYVPSALAAAFTRTVGEFDFNRCAGHRLIGGEPVEVNFEIFAADDRNDLERGGIGLAARQRACRDGRLFPVVMALVGGSGGDRSA